MTSPSWRFERVPEVPFRVRLPLPRSTRDPRDHMDQKHATAPGLYDPSYEHDACGVAFVAHLSGEARPRGRARAVEVVTSNLEHRGATGADPTTGDGAGILIADARRALARARVDFELPPAGPLRRGDVLPPADDGAASRAEVKTLVADVVEAEGQRVLGWRDVPVDETPVRRRRRGAVAPAIRQLFVGASRRAGRRGRVRAQALRHPPRWPRRQARRRPASSPRSRRARIVYKGMLIARQLAGRSSPTCATSASRARWRSCTRASRPTRSRAGSWRTRTG